MNKQETQQDKEMKKILDGLPLLNLGALFMPPIWGPAHGIWIAILYYPMMLFVDNLIYSNYVNPSPLSMVLSIIAVVVTLVITYFFAKISQGYACQRALDKGKTKEQYLKQERIWAIVSLVILVVMVAAATYYNLMIRPFIGA